MTLPEGVFLSMSAIDVSCVNGRFIPNEDAWQTIRAHLLSQDAEIDRIQNIANGNDELYQHELLHTERVESRLAAADALLRETETAVRDLCRCYGHPLPQATLDRIEAHLQGAGES